MEKKKMTKAEAFESLKCKKIDACGCLEEVQKKLFSLGITWVTGDTIVCNLGTYLFVGVDGKLTHGGYDEVYWKHHRFEEIKAEDILSIEIEEEKKEPKMFSDYVAILQSKLKDNEVTVITKTNFKTLFK